MLAAFEEFAERLPFDEFHDHVVRRLFAADFVDGDDIGMPQSLPNFRLFEELLAFSGVAAESAAQHFDGHDLARFAMHGAMDPREGARSDLIEHLVFAEEEPGAVAAQQPFHLIGGDQLAAQQDFLKRGSVQMLGVALHRLKGALIEQIKIEGTLGDLFGGHFGHGLHFSTRWFAMQFK